MAMDLGRRWELWWPSTAADDENFRGEMRRLSHLGLRVIGATEIAVAAFSFLAQMITDITGPAAPGVGRGLMSGRLWEAGLVILVGLGTMALAHTHWGRVYPTALLCCSCWLSSAALITASLLLTPHAPDEYMAAHITTVMLVALIAAPLHPRDTLALGFAIWVFYLAVFLAGMRWQRIDLAAWDTSHLVFLVLLTVISAALAAVL